MIKKYLTQILVASAVLGFSSIANASTNLVVNGDFSNGLSSWGCSS